ncbi:hypothetical protein BDL97_03G086200 [Sphagnum fallax]|nr:hypothetical protein BDL97_03G086200 [Sphagnum fallax]KAH8967617.1 hypothetical protein BDL97_03G086200 [Sphagnum fallax]KAH8967618.1 hypothetical protein BDL97_03G086200 [Sphagnum fallax]KAH8967619.1 hypothetical protein BDL97_03G086200 [Sphagnum fallax]
MESRNDGARYAFIVRWHDPMTEIVWKYQFFYHTFDKSIEMFDIKNHKMFLRRVAYPAISLEQLFIGSTILVYTRQLLIEDYGDDFTRKHLRGLQETTLAMIKPDAIQHTGKILECITSSGFIVKNMRMCQLNITQAETFYQCHKGKPFFSCLTQFIASGPVVAIELVAENALCRWRLLLGPTSSEVARMKAPSSIRAQFGTDCTMNACHGSDSHESARLETLFFFTCTNMGMCAKFINSTLCIIKPHAVMGGCVGAILDRILQKFKVTALEMCNFSRVTAAEFLEVYRGICPDFYAMTHELASGDFLALEVADLCDPGVCPVNAFREFCGPSDPCMARALRPHTLRAEFGINKVKNAVHCTDIPEDGEIEVQHIFKHLWVY